VDVINRWPLSKYSQTGNKQGATMDWVTVQETGKVIKSATEMIFWRLLPLASVSIIVHHRKKKQITLYYQGP
jgi:hypothetical protein